MDGPQALVDRLVRATNDHDIDRLVACFAEDYENETPVHPARGFRGRDQVRRNWEQIFAFVPDVRAEVVRCALDGDTAWTEWEMSGTRKDGSAHLMRGVILFGVGGGVAQWARFYLESVDEDHGTVDDAVREQVVRP
jgi:ketosteroid isomerase-like protein